VRPSPLEIIAAGLLFLVLAGLVVLIVVATVPEGGPPTLLH
jgi:hypothetical protein